MIKMLLLRCYIIYMMTVTALENEKKLLSWTGAKNFEIKLIKIVDLDSQTLQLHADILAFNSVRNVKITKVRVS
jgi:hypothetical protein